MPLTQNSGQHPSARHPRRHTAAFGLRISTAGALYIAITILLGFSAVNTGNNLLFLVVSGLLSFMCVTGYAGMLNLKGLAPELLPPGEVFAGTPVPFRIRIRNTKRRLPSFLLRLESPDGMGACIPLIGQGDSAEGRMTLTFTERGRAELPRITVSSPFPVGFFTRWWTYRLDEQVMVFPRLLAGGVDVAGHEATRGGGAIRRERGVDGELERIVPYSGNEPFRMIHWKLTARTDDLLVKEFGRQAAPPLLIDLERLPGRDREERISQAAWLVRRWVRERPVGLVWGSCSVPAEAGLQQGRRLLTELALLGKDQV
jgi:uncharacterized protein (DUF58 family)